MLVVGGALRRNSARWRRAAAAAAVVTLGMASAGLLDAGPAQAAVAPPPVVDRTSAMVTADALPTAQIDGVVWSQAVVGDTVYAGGKFSNARPAGAASGTNLSPRANLLAYSISTGVLNPSFAPVLNGQVKAVVASPDGSRIYVGGSFTSVDGQQRYRLAAFATATGALVAAWRPTVDATVNSITATNTAVYVGGIFGTANGVSRTRLAAFSADTGATLGWAPTADNIVDAVQLTPNGGNVILGGAFAAINGTAQLGLASVDATTGAMVPFAASTVIKNSGSKSAILSLSTDGTAIYGTGYTYGSGNFEGVFSADPATGKLNWLAACRGDTYGVYAAGGAVYSVSHHHYCADNGGFPDQPYVYQRTDAFTVAATGTVAHLSSYPDFSGQPSPSMIQWFPTLTAGSVTGQDQAAWSIAGNSQYIVEGGEFPSVNGTPQQGLVRFAVPSAAPNTRGPQDTTTATTPTATVASNTSVDLAWKTNWDQDDRTLTYSVYRSGVATPVYTTTSATQFWNRPTLSFGDTGLSPGTTYAYRIQAGDPSGNTVTSAPVTVTTSGTAPAITTASDTFTRTTSGGWGTADTGGPWTVTPASAFATNGSAGSMTLAAPGSAPAATLGSVSVANVSTTVDVTPPAVATGNGYYLMVRARVQGTSAYVMKLRFLPGGVLHLVSSRVDNGSETVLKESVVSGVTYSAGAQLRLAVGVTTSGTTSTLTGTVWPTSATRPATQLTTADAGSTLTGAGAVTLQGYLAGNATSSPIVLTLDNVAVSADGK